MHSALGNLALAAESPARWLDLLGLGLVLLFLALGALRGLWWQVVRLLGIVASISVARAVAPRLAPGIESALPGLGARGANGLAWALVLIACLIAAALVGRLGKAAIQAADLRAFDRVGGALLGGVSGLVVHVAVLLCLLQLSTRTFAESSVRGTVSQRLLDVVGSRLPMLLDARAAESLAPLRGGSPLPREATGIVR